MRDEDHADRIKAVELKTEIMWRGFWGIITLGALYIGNAVLNLLGA